MMTNVKSAGTGPIAYVAQLILDGKGNVSGAGTFDVNGAIVTASVAGLVLLDLKLPKVDSLQLIDVV